MKNHGEKLMVRSWTGIAPTGYVEETHGGKTYKVPYHKGEAPLVEARRCGHCRFPVEGDMNALEQHVKICPVANR